MAEQIKYLDLVGLQTYDTKIKAFIDSTVKAGDEHSFKVVAIDGQELKFYTSYPKSDTDSPAYTVTLPKQDLSNFMELVKTATEGNIATFDANGQVIDSGKKVADFATAAQGVKADSAVQEIVTGDTNGTIKVDGIEITVAGLGTAAYQNVNAFDAAGKADAVLGTSDDVAGTATVHGALASASEAKTAADKAQTDVNALKATVGTVEDGKTVVQMIAEAQETATYDDKAVRDLITANADAIKAEETRAKAAEGDLTTLRTTAKTDLVSAINEVRSSVTTGGIASTVTIDTSSTTEGYLKSYTIKQGDNTIGTIDIPKDMVVQSGSVVTDPDGFDAGTYIKLVLANVDEPLYINVGTLVDIYKAKASATQVQVTVDSATREISAVIVEGSIGTTELADDAVTTLKIANENVTKAKLASDVQASLVKADSAVQNVSTGSAKGTISVDGRDISVNGLGSAAYTDSSAYDVVGAASAVLGTESDNATANTVYGAKAAAKDASDAAKLAKTAADKAQTNVDKLEAYVGTFTAIDNETTVVEYIDKKVSDAKTEASHGNTELSNKVTAIEEDIAKINDETTGILAQAKSYTNTQDTATLASAKAYTDELANGQVSTNKTDIASLTVRVATNETNIATNTANIASLRSDLDAIGTISVEEIAALF